MSRLNITLILALVSIVCLASSVPLDKQQPKNNGAGLSLIDSLTDVENSDENNLLSYDPIDKKRNGAARESSSINKNKPNYDNLERETSDIQHTRKSTSDAGVDSIVSSSAPKSVLGANYERGDSNLASSVEKIAFNSREVRLVGPQRKPVEMKDDIPSKMVVALENLQKEAKDVWGDLSVRLGKGWDDVSGQLEKGFGDLKTIVEGVVSPSTKKQAGKSL